MNNRAQRLRPVQNLVDETERRLAQNLAAFERRVAEGEAKLQDLERYLSEYEQQFSERAAQGIGATGLRDYQAFLAKLAEAIRQQRAVVQRARDERDTERRRWQDAAKRAKALDHVVGQWHAEEQRALDRREQRESDERAQRKVNRP
jgi:flagellar protein FliJ